MSNLQTALNLARLGYYVHPLQERDKNPIAAHGYNDATRDEETIRRWWQDRPNANVGINLHRTGLVDVSSDCPERAAEFRQRGMVHTLLYTSGGGPGHWHALYRLPRGGPVARACVSGQYDIMSEGNAVAPGSIHPSGRTYELLTPLLPVEDLPLAPAWAVELLAEKSSSHSGNLNPADWRDLRDGARLAGARFRALVKANQQLEDVCSGDGVTIAGDSSRSAQRAVFVNQLIRARYPHDEIRALALHFRGVLESNPKYFETDIDRLLHKYTPVDYKPEATRGIDRYEEPPRGGRHYEITTAEMIDGYHQHADCGRRGITLDWTQAEAADHFGVSVGTIKRREAEAAAAGLMRRVVTDDRQRSYIVLSVATWDVRSQCIGVPNGREDAYTHCTEDARASRPRAGDDGAGREESREGTEAPGQGSTIAGWEDRVSVRGTRPADNAEVIERPIYGSGTTWEAQTVDVGSQFDPPQQDAVNVPEDAVCMKGRAHVEITHPPAQPAILSISAPDARGMCVVRWSDGSATWRRDAEPDRHLARMPELAIVPNAFSPKGEFPKSAKYAEMHNCDAPGARYDPALDDEWATADADATAILGEWERKRRRDVDPAIYARVRLVLDGGPPGATGACVLSRAVGPPVEVQQAFITGGSP